MNAYKQTHGWRLGLRWLIAVALFAIVAFLYYISWPSSSDAYRVIPADFADGYMSKTGNIGAQDGWQGPTSYWDPQGAKTCTSEWVLNPKWINDKNGGYPKYVQITLCHQIGAWVPVPPAPDYYGGNIYSNSNPYFPGSSESWDANVNHYAYGVAPNRCHRGQAGIKVNQKIDIPFTDGVDTGQNLYWAHYNQKFCAKNNGQMPTAWQGGINPDSGTGYAGDILGWTTPQVHDCGWKAHDSHTIYSHCWFRVKQTFPIAKGVVRFRTIDYLQKMHAQAAVNGANRGNISVYSLDYQAWCTSSVGCPNPATD